MKDRRFYVQLTMGKKIEVGELDYNNIKSRIHSGRINGYYEQRDEFGPEQFGQFAMNYLVRVWADKPEKRDVTIKKGSIDITKKVSPKVGAGDKPEPKDDKCTKHDWTDPTTWQHVTTIVGGNNRYYKMCNDCKAKSQLVKKREVEMAQELVGETLDTVPLVE